MRKGKLLFTFVAACLLSICSCGTQTTVESRPSKNSEISSITSSGKTSSNPSSSKTSSGGGASNTSSSSSKSSSSNGTSTSSTHTHTPGAPVEENRVEATCQTAGSYDEVVYCTGCHQELSRTPKTIPASNDKHNFEKNIDTLEYVCTYCGAKNGRDYELFITLPKLHVDDEYKYYPTDYTHNFKNDDDSLEFSVLQYEVGGNIIPVETVSQGYGYTFPASMQGQAVVAHLYLTVKDKTKIKYEGQGPSTILKNVDIYTGTSTHPANKVGRVYDDWLSNYQPGGIEDGYLYEYTVSLGTLLASTYAPWPSAQIASGFTTLGLTPFDIPAYRNSAITSYAVGMNANSMDINFNGLKNAGNAHDNIRSFYYNKLVHESGFTCPNYNDFFSPDGSFKITIGGSNAAGDCYISVSKPSYTVTWKNYDGTVLETDTGILAGATPEYNGATPTRPDDTFFTYYFAGWDKEISPVTGDITYTATYQASQFYMTEGEDGWTVTGMVEPTYDGELVMESSLLGKPVIAIAAEALKGANDVLMLTIPDTIRSIGNEAFANMTSMVAFYAENREGNLVEIGWHIFAGCRSLQTIHVPLYGHIGTLFAINEDVGFTQITIDTQTYYVPSNLKEFKDTGGILSSKAFEGTSLTTIGITEQVGYINEEALAGANALVNLTIPYVGNDPDATEPSFNTLFGVIFSKTNLGTGVTQSAYQQYDSSHYIYYHLPVTLKNVTVTGGNLHGYDFSSVATLEKITLKGATNIAERSFYKCSADVILSDGLLTIDDHAFYQSAMTGDIVIPDTVTAIGESAFSSSDNIKSFVIGSGVETIGKSAFTSCKAATSITFRGNKLTTIESMTFYHCEALQTIAIPEGVQEIKGQAFDYCKSMTTASLPSTVTKLSASVFHHCDVLTTVNYNGTKAQWNAIQKASNWYNSSYCPNFHTVVCTDGNITL